MEKFWHRLYDIHKGSPTCPSPADVGIFFNDLLGILYPDHARLSFGSVADFEKHLFKLHDELERILQYQEGLQSGQETSLANKFFSAVPAIYERLANDIQAMYDGDPAANSQRQVIRTYPGFYAIAAYRIAHQLHSLGVTDVPRIITELAHSKTGIDIHPAAVIGDHFCIDHGTGIVIGETTIIGSHVKLYQGVTLGALSISKSDAKKKRHPTLGDKVVVYAGATILGGDTVIGDNSVIGGNVWITKSVPPNSKVYYQSKMYEGEKTVVVFRMDDK
jgi:serine O-acetyltransferase